MLLFLLDLGLRSSSGNCMGVFICLFPSLLFSIEIVIIVVVIGLRAGENMHNIKINFKIVKFKNIHIVKPLKLCFSMSEKEAD